MVFLYPLITRSSIPLEDQQGLVAGWIWFMETRESAFSIYCILMVSRELLSALPRCMMEVRRSAMVGG